MTGYGKATATFGDKKIYVEIKSLNSKAMDLSTRIAPLYREKEMEIRNLISKTLERGKVDVNLWIEKEAAEAATPINTALLQNYYQQIKTISETCNIPLPEDWFATLLRMPDVLTRVDIQELTEEEWNTVRKAIEEALQHLVDFRKQEGAALEKKFTEKIDNIERLMKSIEPYEKERVAKIRERITDALEKTLSIDYDKNRLEQELVLLAQRIDVAEELDRLEAHVKETYNILKKKEGRRLDFLMQEFNRESNTLASKSINAEVTNSAIELKVLIEQMREQIQNIE